MLKELLDFIEKNPEEAKEVWDGASELDDFGVTCDFLINELKGMKSIIIKDGNFESITKFCALNNLNLETIDYDLTLLKVNGSLATCGDAILIGETGDVYVLSPPLSKEILKADLLQQVVRLASKIDALAYEIKKLDAKI